jgi:hypothetical protein
VTREQMLADAGLLCCGQDSGQIEPFAQNSPERGEKMSLNRLFAVFVVLTLLLVAGLTIRSAIATSALVPADHTYDPIERLRAQRDSLKGVDRSYDEIEHIRSARDTGNGSDNSYQKVETDFSPYLIEPAAGRVSDNSYEAVERIRSARDAGGVFDSSYEEVEHLRAQRDSLNAVDRSYDEIEHIRSQRDALNATRLAGQ